MEREAVQVTDFFRYPHTPHLFWLGINPPRDDKVLQQNQVAEFLSGEIVVEEKLDGANVGISVGRDGSLRAQNRGQYLRSPFLGQFSNLGKWLAPREDVLFDALGEHLIAFGEWCAARHSLDYVDLPDWWILFDVYDRLTGRFWSTTRRDTWARSLGIAVVPTVFRGQLTRSQLQALLNERTSEYRHGALEGLVVRREVGDDLVSRAKLVRADFTQSIGEHWSGRSLEWNQLQTSVQVATLQPLR